MITDKIKFPPKYARQDTDMSAYAEIDTENLTPERVWRNLTNISDWPRQDRRIVDIQFEDSADNDPHLYLKAEFYYDLDDRTRVRAHVVCFDPPKDDRVGRLAYDGTVFDQDGKQVCTFVHEFIVGVPDHSGHFTFATAISVKDPRHPKSGDALRQELLQDMVKLTEYCRKHH